MKKQASAGLGLLAFAGLAGEAAAQDTARTTATPWYFGLGLGRTFAKIPQQSIDNLTSSVATLFGGTSLSADTGTSHATEGKIFLGYSFDRHFAVEAGYATLGKATASGLATSGFAFLPINLSYKMTAPYIDAVGTLPLNEKWSLLGRVGVASSRTSASVSIDGLGVSGPSKTKLGEKFGAGIGYNFNSKVTVRAEWESYRMPDPFIDESFRVNAAVLSAIFHF